MSRWPLKVIDLSLITNPNKSVGCLEAVELLPASTYINQEQKYIFSTKVRHVRLKNR